MEYSADSVLEIADFCQAELDIADWSSVMTQVDSEERLDPQSGDYLTGTMTPYRQTVLQAGSVQQAQVEDILDMR